jgi:hypothetical protein
VLVYPENTQQVAQAVSCAASAGYKVSARAGGHSYAAYGLGGEEWVNYVHLVYYAEKLTRTCLAKAASSLSASTSSPMRT